MKRQLMKDLLVWKDSAYRKPLLLYGARQVGKSFILKEFGRNHFERFHYFNFEEENSLKQFFQKDLNPSNILKDLSFHRETVITSDKDLIIFDEIQSCPPALTSLKYFQEKMPETRICAAGSLLGVTLIDTPFPVGKVDIRKIYPMSFREYLWAGSSEILISAFEEILLGAPIETSVHQKLLEKLNWYFVSGGLPEVVENSLGEEDSFESFRETRRLQTQLVTMYQADFAKHSGKVNSVHISMVFSNIASQLGSVMNGSTKRYQFKDVIPAKKGSRDILGPISWLNRAMLVHQVMVNTRAEIPLKSFTSENMFKCFLFDVGLLGAMLNLRPADVIDNHWKIVKGFFAENFVLQELVSSGKQPVFTWTEGTSEIEFLVQSDRGIVPIEVKASHRVQAKSMKIYIDRHTPEYPIILSTREQDLSGRVKHYPLYLAGHLPI